MCMHKYPSLQRYCFLLQFALIFVAFLLGMFHRIVDSNGTSWHVLSFHYIWCLLCGTWYLYNVHCIFFRNNDILSINIMARFRNQLALLSLVWKPRWQGSCRCLPAIIMVLSATARYIYLAPPPPLIMYLLSHYVKYSTVTITDNIEIIVAF